MALTEVYVRHVLGDGLLGVGRYPTTAVFHGHAHNGALEGRTAGGVPVYNVALPLLRKTDPDRPPLRILEITPALPAPAAREPVAGRARPRAVAQAADEGAG